MFDPVALNTLLTVLILVGLNVLLGVVLAIKAGTFDVRQLPRFLQTDVLPILVPLLLLAAASIVYPDLKTVFVAAAAFVVAKYLAEVKDKVTELLGVKFEVNLFKRFARAAAGGPRLPKVGDWVFYKLGNECLRPALIVRVWSPTCCNLVVFLDGSNDTNPDGGCVSWTTSITCGDGPGQWQFPPE
ncbi:MAG: hypothetical protein ACYC9Q_14625 [Bacillota bacterium]